MIIAYLGSTVRQTLLQPAIIFLVILQAATVVFFVFGVSFEYRGETLISISLLGMEPLTGHGLLIARQSFDHFIRLGWEVFKFLLIIGIAPSFVELLKDPLLSIVLTKKISRAQLMLMRWSGIILSVGIIQALYATSMVLVLLFKTSVLSVSFIIPVILGPLAYVITFAALACLLGILFEHATGVTVVVLAVNYIGAFVESVTQQTESWVRLIGYLFPPLATTEKFFLDTMLYGSPDGILPERLLVYPIAYLTLAILLFRQKDL